MKAPDQYNPTGQCCELDEPYQAPPGYFDQPFWYVYNGDNLTNGQDARNVGITTYSGSDFILRRVAGMDRLCTQFQLRDNLWRLLFDTTQGAYTAGFNDFPLVPELLYPASAGITFDLLNVQKVLNSGLSAAPLSQIVFQGVRRFQGYKRPPSYPYWEDEFSYPITFNITTAPNSPPVKYAIDIYDFDFELLRILEVINPGSGGGLPGDNVACKIMLYDQVYEQVFSAPVIDDLMMDNSVGYRGIVPVPGIVYRIGQQIKFDVTSMITPDVGSGGVIPVSVQLKFQGVRRRPC